VRDAQCELDERAGLAEEDQRIDAGERRLSELGDRDLLSIARFQLRAKLQHLRRTRVGAPVAVLHEVEERMLGHDPVSRVYVGRKGKTRADLGCRAEDVPEAGRLSVLTTIHTAVSIES
jgi:hypothetical protein